MSQDTGLCFAQFPKNFDKLRAVLVAVQASHDVHVEEACPGPRQFYREIIFTEPDLLIAPESEENVVSKNAVVIAEKDMLESGKFCGTLQKSSLEQKTSISLTRSLFLYCLQFVLTHRLAPLWNKIDKYFIQGRDFLREENKMCAIQADFSLTDKITLAMKAQLVKLPKPKFDDFGVSPNIIQMFHQSDDFSIHGYSLENNKCLVLPSLKTGYITCISHRDSQGIDFKRYWKVMYGFRLPVSERDVYYGIRFPMSVKVLSYPEYCIRHKEPQVSVRCDQKAIFKSFLEDLTLRMPSICGLPLTFTSSTLYPTKSLHLASISKQTNLSRAPMPSKANQPFTCSKKNGDVRVIPSSNMHNIPRCSKVMNTALHGIQSQDIVQAYQGSVVVSSRNMHNIPRCSKVMNTALHGIQSQDIVQAYQGSVVVSSRNMHNIPQCSKVMNTALHGIQSQDIVQAYQGSVVVSNLNMYLPQCSKVANAALHGIQSQNIDQPTVNEPPNAAVTKPYVPSFTKHKSAKALSKKLPKVSEIRKEKPLVPCFRKTVSLSKPNTNNLKVKMAKSRSAHTLQKQHIGVVHTLNGAALDSTEQITGVRMIHEGNSRPLMEQNQPIEKQSTELQKKTAKPKELKADVVVDVRKMVAENKLSKVSVAAITKWLKSEGVKCKCKEKKHELMFKVYQHLGLKQPEL